ncbi:heparan-sulfate 6-O-sulfotransferase 3-like isoform X2 [Clavelina lepadiformis]|uniref:heparan-sulfate 6-O-sulfotransferase 3-like isoform X2 n=1 Tax=Clavelina lepadiformis TaxID=159417 RepID=UPI00404233D8
MFHISSGILASRRKFILCLILCVLMMVSLRTYYSSSFRTLPKYTNYKDTALRKQYSSFHYTAPFFQPTVNYSSTKISKSQPIGKYKKNGKETIPYEKNFDINGTDIIVFLHMQKTGGSTFGRHLVFDLQLERRCEKKLIKKNKKTKKRTCLRPSDDSEWLFSRFTTGWACGLHADWTSLTECVPQYFPLTNITRRYFYITMLREPVARYLSEWKHVARGATWDTSYLLCNGKKYDYTFCWAGENWSGVPLSEFMNCSTNMANNRQTYMLADLKKIGCDGSGMSFATAGKEMVFFGLTERQKATQFLFENSFNLKFNIDFFDRNDTYASSVNETEDIIHKIRQLNALDVDLYEYAVKLFNERLNQTLRFSKS